MSGIVSFHATVEAYDGDASEVDSIVFTTSCLGIVLTTVSLQDPNHATAAEWLALANGEAVDIKFCRSNGNVSVHGRRGAGDHGLDTISFEVSKHGAGGDGVITHTVPLALCRDSLLQVSTQVAAIHALAVIGAAVLDS